MSLRDFLISMRSSRNVATAIPAIFATEPREQGPTVAKIATVAIANFQNGTDRTLKIAKIAKVAVASSQNRKTVPMTAAEEKAVRAWLGHIGETSETMIAETLRQCNIDERERAFFLERAKEVPQANADTYQDDRRHCSQCANLTRAGFCLAAKRGEINEIPSYRPADTLPRRCTAYKEA